MTCILQSKVLTRKYQTQHAKIIYHSSVLNVCVGLRSMWIKEVASVGHLSFSIIREMRASSGPSVSGGN